MLPKIITNCVFDKKLSCVPISLCFVIIEALVNFVLEVSPSTTPHGSLSRIYIHGKK